MKLNRFFLCLGLIAGVAACGPKDNPDTPSGGGDNPEAAKPSAPTGLKIHKAEETSLQFQWDDMQGATSYDYTLALDGAVLQEGNVKTRNAVLSGLAKATTYTFTVYSLAKDFKSSGSSISAKTAGTADPDPGPGPSGVKVTYADFGIPASEDADGEPRAFPGAEGGGMYTTGGRGGEVYHVTNLNDSGQGSLRDGITNRNTDTNGEYIPRTIVFDVAGIINLQSKIQINGSKSVSRANLTIAGQTAPGGGICLKNYTVNVNADNVIIRFLHFRLGDEGPNAGDSEDCIWGRYLTGIVLDHCSMSWSIDECASFYGNEYFTMQWCILTESMNDSAHSKGSHGYGGIWGGKDASFHHNMLANHHSRNPRIDHPEIYPKNNGVFDWSKRGNVDLRNLVIYNWGDNSTYGGEGGKYNLVNCYYKPGPSTAKDRYYFIDAYSVYSSSKVNYGYPLLYMNGNIHTAHDDLSENNLVHGVYFHEASSYSLPAGYSFQASAYPIGGPGGKAIYTTTHSAEEGKDAVLEWAGDRLHRDSVDERAVSGFKSNTGKIINTPADVGGWPSYSGTTVKDTDKDGIPDDIEDAWGFDKNDASDAGAYTIDSTRKRYTNLEMYLHYLVKDIVAGGNQSGIYTKL